MSDSDTVTAHSGWQSESTVCHGFRLGLRGAGGQPGVRYVAGNPGRMATPSGANTVTITISKYSQPRLPSCRQ